MHHFAKDIDPNKEPKQTDTHLEYWELIKQAPDNQFRIFPIYPKFPKKRIEMFMVVIKKIMGNYTEKYGYVEKKPNVPFTNNFPNFPN